MAQAQVKKGISIEDGKHDAIISKYEERGNPKTDDQPYHYIDIFFKIEDGNVEIKKGFPATISPSSGLCKFLKSMGTDVDTIIDESEGTSIDLDEILDPIVGKEVSIMTVKEDSGFSRVVDGSVKLR